MIVRTPVRRVMSAGLILLATANIGRWVLDRHTNLAEGPRDAVAGFLFGLAIATTLLGIWMTKRQDDFASR